MALLLPSSFADRLRVMDFIIEQFFADYDVNAKGSFATTYDRKQTLLKLNFSPFTASNGAPITTDRAHSTGNWHVTAILCGDGECHLSRESYFVASYLDGAVSVFWPHIWGSLNIKRALKMHHHFVDRPFSAATRPARLLRRQEKGPARGSVNVEGYPKNFSLILMKNTLKRGPTKIWDLAY